MVYVHCRCDCQAPPSSGTAWRTGPKSCTTFRTCPNCVFPYSFQLRFASMCSTVLPFFDEGSRHGVTTCEGRGMNVPPRHATRPKPTQNLREQEDTPTLSGWPWMPNSPSQNHHPLPHRQDVISKQSRTLLKNKSRFGIPSPTFTFH